METDRELTDIMKAMSQEAFQELISLIQANQGEPSPENLARVQSIDRELESIFTENFWVRLERTDEAAEKTGVLLYSRLSYKSAVFNIGDGRNAHESTSRKEAFAIRRVHMVLNLIKERKILTR